MGETWGKPVDDALQQRQIDASPQYGQIEIQARALTLRPTTGGGRFIEPGESPMHAYLKASPRRERGNSATATSMKLGLRRVLR